MLYPNLKKACQDYLGMGKARHIFQLYHRHGKTGCKRAQIILDCIEYLETLVDLSTFIFNCDSFYASIQKYIKSGFANFTIEKKIYVLEGGNNNPSSLRTLLRSSNSLIELDHFEAKKLFHRQKSKKLIETTTQIENQKQNFMQVQYQKQSFEPDENHIKIPYEGEQSKELNFLGKDHNLTYLNLNNPNEDLSDAKLPWIKQKLNYNQNIISEELFPIHLIWLGKTAPLPQVLDNIIQIARYLTACTGKTKFKHPVYLWTNQELYNHLVIWFIERSECSLNVRCIEKEIFGNNQIENMFNSNDCKNLASYVYHDNAQKIKFRDVYKCYIAETSGSMASFAAAGDLIRLVVLYLYGGLYVDAGLEVRHFQLNKNSCNYNPLDQLLKMQDRIKLVNNHFMTHELPFEIINNFEGLDALTFTQYPIYKQNEELKKELGGLYFDGQADFQIIYSPKPREIFFLDNIHLYCLFHVHLNLRAERKLKPAGAVIGSSMRWLTVTPFYRDKFYDLIQFYPCYTYKFKDDASFYYYTEECFFRELPGLRKKNQKNQKYANYRHGAWHTMDDTCLKKGYIHFTEKELQVLNEDKEFIINEINENRMNIALLSKKYKITWEKMNRFYVSNMFK